LILKSITTKLNNYQFFKPDIYQVLMLKSEVFLKEMHI